MKKHWLNPISWCHGTLPLKSMLIYVCCRLVKPNAIITVGEGGGGTVETVDQTLTTFLNFFLFPDLLEWGWGEGRG
jgi:hypothetical protein